MAAITPEEYERTGLSYERCDCTSCRRTRRNQGLPEDPIDFKLFLEKSDKTINAPNICSKCGSPTVERTNGYTGKVFTGCSGWPSCLWTSNRLKAPESAKKTGETMKTTPQIDKFIKFETSEGSIVGTIIGKNESSGNLIVRVDKKSPIKGWKLDDDMLYTIEENVAAKYQKGLKSYTYWNISPKDEVEEATKRDLLDGAEDKGAEDSEAAAEEATRIAVDVKNVDFSKFEKVIAETTKETKMSDKKSAMQIVKSDGEKATMRVAGKKLSNGANALITKGIKAAIDPKHGESVDAIMASPIGTMFTRLAMGWTLTYAPSKYAQNARLQQLAEEFRVQGTADGMEMIADTVLVHVEPLLKDALSLLDGEQEQTNTRVAEMPAPPAAVSQEQLAEQEEHELSEAAGEEKKKAAAGK